jgi:hypothetical protein
MAGVALACAVSAGALRLSMMLVAAMMSLAILSVLTFSL